MNDFYPIWRALVVEIAYNPGLLLGVIVSCFWAVYAVIDIMGDDDVE